MSQEQEQQELPMDLDNQVLRLLTYMVACFREVLKEREQQGDTVAGDFANWLDDRMTLYSGDANEIMEQTKTSEEAWDWLAQSPKDPSKLGVLHRLIEIVNLQDRPEPQHRLKAVVVECHLVYEDNTATLMASKFAPEPGAAMLDVMLVPHMRKVLNQLVDEVARQGIDGLKEKSRPLQPSPILAPMPPGGGGQAIPPGALRNAQPGGRRIITPGDL